MSKIVGTLEPEWLKKQIADQQKQRYDHKICGTEDQRIDIDRLFLSELQSSYCKSNLRLTGQFTLLEMDAPSPCSSAASKSQRSASLK